MVAHPADPGRVAGEAARAFDAAGIPYLVGGSVASTVHGEPRGTLDVDFAVHMEPAQAEGLRAALAERFIVDVLSIREAALAKRMFNAIHSELFVKADVHVRESTGHSKAEMDRAMEVELTGAGGLVRVASPEDVVLRKLWWFREGGEVSERQWRDVLGVLRVRGDRLELDHMERWAGALGVEELLSRALGER